MGMHFHWLPCRDSQRQYRYYWAPRSNNRANYWTKHHCATMPSVRVNSTNTSYYQKGPYPSDPSCYSSMIHTLQNKGTESEKVC
jgi:hypothetical protein